MSCGWSLEGKGRGGRRGHGLRWCVVSEEGWEEEEQLRGVEGFDQWWLCLEGEEQSSEMSHTF